MSGRKYIDFLGFEFFKRSSDDRKTKQFLRKPNDNSFVKKDVKLILIMTESFGTNVTTMLLNYKKL